MMMLRAHARGDQLSILCKRFAAQIFKRFTRLNPPPIGMNPKSNGDWNEDSHSWQFGSADYSMLGTAPGPLAARAGNLRGDHKMTVTRSQRFIARWNWA